LRRRRHGRAQGPRPERHLRHDLDAAVRHEPPGRLADPLLLLPGDRQADHRHGQWRGGRHRAGPPALLRRAIRRRQRDLHDFVRAPRPDRRARPELDAAPHRGPRQCVRPAPVRPPGGRRGGEGRGAGQPAGPGRGACRGHLRGGPSPRPQCLVAGGQREQATALRGAVPDPRRGHDRRAPRDGGERAQRGLPGGRGALHREASRALHGAMSAALAQPAAGAAPGLAMESLYTPAERAFAEEVREFVARNLPADIRDRLLAGGRETREDVVAWTRILHARGWSAYRWPVEYGGPGFTPVQCAIFDDVCASMGAPELVPFGHRMVAPVLMRYGTEEQKRRFLPPIASGDAWWAQGYSEPGAGSDLASLRTRARRDGDHYVVDGQKIWTTSAHLADWIFCLVRTSDGPRKQDGISFLLVDLR